MDIWKEGKQVDLWSVNHFLSGVVFTGWMLPLNFNWASIFFVYLVLAILWEVFEILRGVHEHFWNRFVDVFLGVLGFFYVYLVKDANDLMNLSWLIFLSVIFAILELHGFQAYQKRKKRKS